MTDRFIPVEIFSLEQVSSCPSNMIYGNSNVLRYYKIELYRLLTGVSAFKCDFTGTTIHQKSNFSKLPFKYSKNLNPKIGRNISMDTKKLINSLSNQNNRGFYDEILKEFYCYFYEYNLNNHLSCFVHLYRILERIAICIPLVYAASTPNYQGVFNDFKKYFLDNKIGELKVLEKFIPSFIDSNILNMKFQLNFEPLANNWHENHFNAIKKINLHESASPYSNLEFKYEKILSLIINIRNKYFHALTGANNSFKANEIIHSNEFFKTINPVCCNWLGYIIIQVLKLEVQ